MDTIDLVGTAAALCSTVSFLPQAIKVIQTRDTKSISTGMYSVTVCGFILWTSYGVLKTAWPIIISNSICLVLSIFILTMKLLPPNEKTSVATAMTGGKKSDSSNG